LTEDVIGLEGLKMVAEQKRMKKGTMLSEITFPNFPLIAKNCGLDFLLIDGEHGAFDYSAMSALIMNANLIGLDTIIRIGGNQRETIIKYADMGAKGFLLPMTNCREDIAEVVKYAKYPPVGKRGVSTTRAHTCYNPPKLTEYMKTANSRMKIFAQIETREGIENLSEILQTEGITGVLIGPNDLSVDLECIDNKDTILECIESISSAAKSENRQWGIITKDAAYIAKAKECDADLISYGSELNMLIDGCKKISEKI
jgi:2-keto-3-deoxy-L-rhamnonate aldolase RhmA